ncbi:7985_t:CDS:2 [Gigaspora margarita]|uniref:7985_t:CDS:1 n=1 Tax=Gigaspora margarita TaxID=4874 RepID=A0ABN7UBV4_GIGMA|nr:7985_t:CDS:2 [Gigaspora margarita]
MSKPISEHEYISKSIFEFENIGKPTVKCKNINKDNIRTFEYEYTSETFKHGDSKEMVLEDVKN